MTSHGGTYTPFSQSLWFLTPHSICLYLVPSHLGPRSLPTAIAHRGMVCVYSRQHHPFIFLSSLLPLQPLLGSTMIQWNSGQIYKLKI